MNGLVPGFELRQVIVDTAIDQIGADYWTPFGWKTPNRTILGTFVWGDMRCDGVVEYCFEQAGLDPGEDNAEFMGGPQYQAIILDTVWNECPMAWFDPPLDAYTEEGAPYTTYDSEITLEVSGSDVHSGLAPELPFTYFYSVYTNGMWQTELIGKGNDSRDFEFPYVDTTYRFHVAVYDNGGASALSDSIYVRCERAPGWVNGRLYPYEVTSGENDARFRVDGGSWHAAFSTVEAFEGEHLVEFEPVEDWVTPPERVVEVVPGETSFCTGVYAAAEGAVRVFLDPPEAVSEDARWYISVWSPLESGTTVSNLPSGTDIRISFQDTPHWLAPDDQVITVPNESIAQATGIYVQAMAALQVRLRPPAVTNDARWRYVQNGMTSAWQVSHETLPVLANTGLRMEYLDVNDWITPAPRTISISPGETATEYGVYRQHGALQVWIEPSEAVADGARWGTPVPGPEGGCALDRGSGAIVTGLLAGAGTHFVSFTDPMLNPDDMSNTWWDVPLDGMIPVEIVGNELTVITGRYACTRGAVCVDLAPDEANDWGAAWSLNTEPDQWLGDSEILYGVVPGNHEIVFTNVPGLHTPSNVAITVVADESVVTNGLYVRRFYPDLYAAEGGPHVFPYTNPATAASNIQAALNLAMSGSSVHLDTGTYALDAPLVMEEGVALIGIHGAGQTVLSGCSSSRCVQLVHSNCLVTGVTIRDGRAQKGGGVFCAANSELRDCVITRCTADLYGGGIFLREDGSVVDCHIVSNTASTFDDGGVYLARGGSVSNSLIEWNSGRKAGGVFLEGGGLVRNCVVRHNSAAMDGGGVLCYLPGGSVQSCTVVQNEANVGGGFYGNIGGVLHNCIVYHNTSNTETDNANAGGQWFVCCTTPARGQRCVPGDPQLVDLSENDVRLGRGSPCVDAGTNQAWMAGASDLDESPRLTGPRVDIGAYERTAEHYAAQGGSNRWPYLSWDDAAPDLADALAAAGRQDTVHVASGTYHPGGPLVVPSDVWLLGTTSSPPTVIDGQGLHRCVLVSPGATIERLCIVQGSAIEGGGIYCSAPGSRVQDCTIGLCQGRYGGGIYLESACRLHNSVLLYNLADVDGGGAYALRGAVIEGCDVRLNEALGSGGGVGMDGAVLENCTIVSNTGGYGGGFSASGRSWIQNCLVVRNEATSGQGGGGTLVDGTMRHVTVARNTGGTAGGLWVSNATVESSIVYSNELPEYVSHGAAWKQCCTHPPIGEKCIPENPCFVDLGHGDYSLLAASDCVDGCVSGPDRDLAGAPRPLDGDANGSAGYDIGAYELMNEAADSDHDGLTDGDEMAIDTDPADPGSCLRIADLTMRPKGVQIHWTGGSNAWHYLDRTFDLSSQPVLWVPVHTAVPPTDAEFWIEDPLGSHTERFYRVRSVGAVP